MRVTTDKKIETRQRILQTARKLFIDNGFEQTSTRDMASLSGIAAGTLFNYFPTKESIAMSLVAAELEEAEADFHRHDRVGASLEEQLFHLVIAGLRRLVPMRPYVGEIMQAALSPFVRSPIVGDGEEIRVNHLEAVQRILSAHGVDMASDQAAVALHLYWSLYMGIVAFWAVDSTPNQEATLAVLDQAIRMFTASLPMSVVRNEERSYGTETNGIDRGLADRSSGTAERDGERPVADGS